MRHRVLTGLVLATLAASSHAAPVTWYVDAVLADPFNASVPSGSLIGSFVYDSDAEAYGTVSLNLNDSSAVSFYDRVIFSDSNDRLHVFAPSGIADLTGTVIATIYMSPASALTNGGGTYQFADYAVDPAWQASLGTYACLVANCGSTSYQITRGVSGTISSVAPVPVPAAAWLLGAALAVLGWIRRTSISLRV